MFDLTSNEDRLYKTHYLRLERSATDIIRIEVHEILQLGLTPCQPKFFARVIDSLGIPDKKLSADGDSIEEAINGIFPQL
ncbi:hypothetical protein P3339_08000 [Microbulbifer sp. MLAF003]|uniref:hypothetical protein n=1 Tax=Microbulbifer sp. MLAF003 TaxID=3032582 RepID=UPI0024AD59D1|nr:hypothetical protein [Microbulbifer sp. MLAF003]WHI52690.1 hypothetical protein P3339_08000 [Microbulbifer sp. MLAF003]